jgi:BirA family biotin operon repressor/biotin-[acetyl-CoA-carboxylase] ligase
MPIAHQLAGTAGIRSGTVVLAEEQTAGRGRLQRRWEAPSGQALLMSVIFKPPWLFTLEQLPMLIGIALARGLEQWEPRLQGQVGLKWPNDLLLGQQRQAARKVAGILIESAWQGDQPAYAIVGIGLNVNQSASELPTAQRGAPAPISLRLYLEMIDCQHAQNAPMVERTGVLLSVCSSLSQLLCEIKSTPYNLVEQWRARLWTLGEVVTVTANDSGHWRGQAVDVTNGGALLVETKNGERCAFAAGDVTIRNR